MALLQEENREFCTSFHRRDVPPELRNLVQVAYPIVLCTGCPRRSRSGHRIRIPWKSTGAQLEGDDESVHDTLRGAIHAAGP